LRACALACAPRAYLVVVGHVGEGLARLGLDREAQGLVQPVDELLAGLGVDAEADRDVVAVDARLQALDVAADVGLRLDQVA
jgi:hypothetical protein